MSVEFLQSSGEAIAYIARPPICPDQPTVVFLPGLRSDMLGTKSLFLQDICREKGWGFISLDYSGHGQSEGNFLAGTIGKWLENTRDVLTHCSTQSLIVVGSSMGGWLMFHLVPFLKHRLKGLVGVAAAPDFTEFLIRPRLTELQKYALATQGLFFDGAEDAPDALPITARLLNEGEQHLVLDKTIALSCPISLIHGTEDTVVPASWPLKIMKQLQTDAPAHAVYIHRGDHRLSQPEHLRILEQHVTAVATSDIAENVA